MSLLPIPFIWGPVGGAESMPASFRRTLSWRGKGYETLRDFARGLGEYDPMVRMTAKRAALGLATTEATKARLMRLGCRNTRVFSEAGLTEKEIAALGQMKVRGRSVFRVLSSGNLLHLKGFELSLRAFAMVSRSGLEAEYWILGDGPERDRLEAIARELGVSDKVVFWGRLDRSQALQKLADCDVLIHPSLHDSGGWVCLEAMAAGRPVICLDLGGPGMQVTQHTGIKVPAITPEQTIRDLAAAIHRLSRDSEFRERLARAGREFVRQSFAWTNKAECMRRNYIEFAQVRR